MVSQEYFFHVGRKILWFIIQLIILIFCIWYIDLIYNQDIYPDMQVEQSYVSTQCLISDKRLIGTHGFLHRFRADFFVNFSVNSGNSFQAWTSANGLDRSLTTDRVSQLQQLDNFNIGTSYPCWYNPNDPNLVVLVLRHTWTSTFPLFIPSVISLIMLYYLFGEIFAFFGFIIQANK